MHFGCFPKLGEALTPAKEVIVVTCSKCYWIIMHAYFIPPGFWMLVSFWGKSCIFIFSSLYIKHICAYRIPYEHKNAMKCYYTLQENSIIAVHQDAAAKAYYQGANFNDLWCLVCHMTSCLKVE